MDDRLIIAVLKDLAASSLSEATRATLFKLALRELSQCSMPDAVASELLGALFGQPAGPKPEGFSVSPAAPSERAVAPEPPSARPEAQSRTSDQAGLSKEQGGLPRAPRTAVDPSKREAPFVVTVSTPEGASIRTSVRVPQELLGRAAAASGGFAPLRAKVAQWIANVPPGVSRSGWVKSQLAQVLDQH